MEATTRPFSVQSPCVTLFSALNASSAMLKTYFPENKINNIILIYYQTLDKFLAMEDALKHYQRILTVWGIDTIYFKIFKKNNKVIK